MAETMDLPGSLSAQQHLLPPVIFLAMLTVGMELRVEQFRALFYSPGSSRLAGFAAEDAITVALEGSIRNLGVAFLIAANTLGRVDIAVFPTVYFLFVLVFSILFAKNWRRIPGLNFR